MDSGKAHPTNSEQECPRASAFFRAFEKVPTLPRCHPVGNEDRDLLRAWLAIKVEIAGPICRNHPFGLDGKGCQARSPKIISKSRSPLIPPLSFPTVELVPYHPAIFDDPRAPKESLQ